MALSNIFNEPRREIMESVVGIGATVAYIGFDYGISCWLRLNDPMDSHEFAACMIIVVPFLTALVAFILFIIHEIGDAICTALEKRGVQMRPRNRPRANG